MAIVDGRKFIVAGEDGERLDMPAIVRHVRDHLLAQGQKALRFVGQASCAYRESGGLACAIGCLIPDERYERGLEGVGVTEARLDDLGAPIQLPSVVCRAAFGDYVPSALELALLHELQKIHDDRLVDEWPTYLDDLVHYVEFGVAQ